MLEPMGRNLNREKQVFNFNDKVLMPKNKSKSRSPNISPSISKNEKYFVEQLKQKIKQKQLQYHNKQKLLPRAEVEALIMKQRKSH